MELRILWPVNNNNNNNNNNNDDDDENDFDFKFVYFERFEIIPILFIFCSLRLLHFCIFAKCRKKSFLRWTKMKSEL